MRGRLLTNGILSVAGLILFIFYIVMLVEIANGKDVYSTVGNNNHYWSNSGTKYEIWALLSLIALIFTNIATFIMGIVTLATQKHDNAKGLTIASGILGIFSGLLGVGAIISFIGYGKAK